MEIFLRGGSGGIGKAIKKTLEDNQINVISPDSKTLDLIHDLDVSNYPLLDGFIHCAGVNNINTYDKLTSEDIFSSYKINTTSFIELCSKLKLKDKSNIIAIGSLYATQTKQGRIPYTMSKHALLGAVKTLAIEMSSKQIKVNMVSPGFVDTPLTRKNNQQNRISYLDASIPLGLTSPQSIADICNFLITQNQAITGQNLIVDGGYSLIGI